MLRSDGRLTSGLGASCKAKQLLQTGMQQEGWTSVSQIPPITLTYASTGVAASKNEVAILQQEWQSVLGISVKTAETYRTRIMEKLDVHETASLVRYAIRRGMVQP